MNNTIILLEGKANLTRREYKKFAKGDTIWGNVTEYALEYCECDEDGEFIQGADFDLAEEK